MGNCELDVDECASNPCLNGGTCFQTDSNTWRCQCHGYEGEMCETPHDMCSSDENDCDPNNAECVSSGPGVHSCACHIGWTGSGEQCDDVNECSSGPCENNAVCTQSECLSSSYPDGYVASDQLPDGGGISTSRSRACVHSEVPADAYKCSCQPGYAGGLCGDENLVNPNPNPNPPDNSVKYTASCQIAHDSRCHIDMDECVSNPCENNARCSDSTTPSSGVSIDQYKCTCQPGFADGYCEYSNIAEVSDLCSNTNGGNCGQDVNECLSNPCQNGALCSDSTSLMEDERLQMIIPIPYDTYGCACLPGYANGLCEYDFIQGE